MNFSNERLKSYKSILIDSYLKIFKDYVIQQWIKKKSRLRRIFLTICLLTFYLFEKSVMVVTAFNNHISGEFRRGPSITSFIFDPREFFMDVKINVYNDINATEYEIEIIPLLPLFTPKNRKNSFLSYVFGTLSAFSQKRK